MPGAWLAAGARLTARRASTTAGNDQHRAAH
eukprot:CAMPEP_0202089992 /NCGR_PEP_ID=MMETSP0964-20121228/42608_1 /ASSEMBLY_ACC=CAM_ASM_000500 /TAXON_ID=4773 /ORGANISM="Schizochytrium aggregatum, Strain ATCC28209" /LENGTH=30 /DNA_ID= /DNA_START= /DNA_END= /DNA_ORIENTATION=